MGAGRSKGLPVKNVRFTLSTALAALVVGGLASLPAQAATPAPAASPKPAAVQAGTWDGRIQKDGGHYDDVGRACPESQQICYAIVARYRIVPLNASAARAVKALAGGQARLTGRLSSVHDSRHMGTLFVGKAAGPATTARTVQADETSNGQTMALHPGDHLTVVLHSTYWQFNAPSDSSVVSPDGDPVYAGGGPNCGGPPGSGCGTVTAHYTAGHDGQAVVSAGRTSCGEALRCTPAQSRWAVTVKVTG
jgi:hypothetical protein